MTSFSEQSTPSNPLNPKQVLIDWANQQDAWVRRLVQEVLVTARPVPETTIETLYELFKTEKGLVAQAEVAEVPPIDAANGDADEEESLTLTRLSEVKGVNALADGYEIAFNAGLTVLFGENGTGKTGYARVIKRAAAVRTAEEILPNAHATTSQPSPSASIDYVLGEEPGTIAWQNEEGVSPLVSSSRCESGCQRVQQPSSHELRWAAVTEAGAGAVVQLERHVGETVRAVPRELRSLGEVLAKEPVGVLIGPALPRRVRVGEVDADAGLCLDPFVVEHLIALVPGQ